MATTTVFRAQESLPQGEVTGIAQGTCTEVGPASYATGGIALDFATDEALPNDPHDVRCEVILTSTGAPDAANYAVYDYTAKKAVVFVRTTGIQIANTSDLSARTLRYHWKASKA